MIFEEDSDEEMDIIEIEEEDSIEYKKEVLLTHWTRWNLQRFVA